MFQSLHCRSVFIHTKALLHSGAYPFCFISFPLQRIKNLRPAWPTWPKHLQKVMGCGCSSTAMFLLSVHKTLSSATSTQARWSPLCHLLWFTFLQRMREEGDHLTVSAPPTLEEESPCKLLSLITGTGRYFTGPLTQKGDYVLKSVGFEL